MRQDGADPDRHDMMQWQEIEQDRLIGAGVENQAGKAPARLQVHPVSLGDLVFRAVSRKIPLWSQKRTVIPYLREARNSVSRPFPGH
jgi:hypothetical protein